MGTSWGPLGGLCGPLGGLLGASWEPPGVSWMPLGGLLGASWGHLERSAGVLFAKAKRGDVSFRLRCDLEPSWGCLGAVLGTSWGHPGPIWGPSWAIWGPLWAFLSDPKRIKAKLAKTYKNLRKIKVFAPTEVPKTGPR